MKKGSGGRRKGFYGSPGSDDKNGPGQRGGGTRDTEEEIDRLLEQLRKALDERPGDARLLLRSAETLLKAATGERARRGRSELPERVRAVLEHFNDQFVQPSKEETGEQA